MAIPAPYITAKQAAQEVGLSYARIRQLLNQSRIKGAFKAPRDWLIPSPVEILPPRKLRPSEDRSTTGPTRLKKVPSQRKTQHHEN